MPLPGGSTAAVLEAPAAANTSAVVEAPLKSQAAALEALLQQPAAADHRTTIKQAEQHGSSQVSTAAPPGLQQTTSRYMCYFLHRLLDFRVPELRALADMFGVKQLDIEPIPEAAVHSGSDAWPFRMVQLPGDDVATRIAERSVLLKGVFDVWGEGSSSEEMLQSVASHPAHCKAPYLQRDASFKIIMSTVGFKWNEKQYRHYVHEVVESIGFEGDVELENPRNTFWVVTVDSDGEAGMHAMPTRWVFGRQVALGDRSFLSQYNLPQRAYIGPTSMDPELAFLMTNMAQVTSRSLVMDPYVGTGSILVAAAARGAATFGSDIDHRVVMAGKSHPKTGAKLTVFSNYEQYGLQWPVGLVRMDVHRHPFRTGLTEVFDAMLGDPPYGVRAGGRKSKCKPDACIRNRETYIPSTSPYTLTECLTDLLELAAVLLVTGGRLVFWMPSSPELYSEDELPQHPMLQLLDNSEQNLTSRYGRRLITMVKVKPYDAAAAAEFKQQREGYVMALERLTEIVYSSKEELAAAAAAAAAAGGSTGSSEGSGQQVVVPSMPKYRGKGV